MNAPIKIAQAGSQPGAGTMTVVTLEKPADGQAVTVQTGYDGKIKLDFSKIADERITIVRVGEKAIIFFHDNQSTVTLEPDTTILPHCVIQGSTVIGAACTIGPHAVITDSTLADHVTVLMAGEVLARGSYETVRTDERVINAYLGEESHA